MTLSLVLARSPLERDRVFRLRHQVYIEEEQRFEPRPDGRMYDRFDCFPSTGNVLAFDRELDETAGTLRFAIKSEVGLPSDSFYDFGPIIKERKIEGGICTIGMLVVAQKYRHSRGLVLGMFKVAARELRRNGGRHILAPVAPDIENVLLAMGAEQVGEVITLGKPPVSMTPLHIDMDKFTPIFRETALDPHNILIDDINERRLYRHNEAIIQEGQRGHEAYLIMRGAARVFSGDASNPSSTYLLGPGEIFGELAIIDGDAHPATVVTHSRVLDAAVIPREQFQKRIGADIDFARRMLFILGQRVRKLLLHMQPEAITAHQEALAANILLEVSENATKPVAPIWLASECGLKEEELSTIVAAWESAGVVRSNGGLIEVASAIGLRILIDHAVAADALVRRGKEVRA